MLLDPTLVRQRLQRLHNLKPAPFGVNSHRCALNPVFPELAVHEFGEKYGITLPSEYRHFVTHIGNGGAGPFYGIFPVGFMDGVSSELQRWDENDGIVDLLEQPFPFTDEWNDVSGQPDPDLSEANPELYEQQIELFDRTYWGSQNVNGAIPICHMGCAIRVWLILSGAEAGHLWRDGRADYTGLSPIKLHDGSRATFSECYSEWLDEPFCNKR